MRNVTAEHIYETVSGSLLDEYCVPGVENEFAEGAPCENLYSQVLDAYQRLCERLKAGEEDPDVEIIIDSFLQMTKILCLKMFDYGASFAKHI